MKNLLLILLLSVALISCAKNDGTQPHINAPIVVQPDVPAPDESEPDVIMPTPTPVAEVIATPTPTPTPAPTATPIVVTQLFCEGVTFVADGSGTNATSVHCTGSNLGSNYAYLDLTAMFVNGWYTSIVQVYVYDGNPTCIYGRARRPGFNQFDEKTVCGTKVNETTFILE